MAYLRDSQLDLATAVIDGYAEQAPLAERTRWPGPILEYLRGRIDSEELLRRADATNAVLDDSKITWRVLFRTGGEKTTEAITGDQLLSLIEEKMLTIDSWVWRPPWPEYRLASEVFPEDLAPVSREERRTMAHSVMALEFFSKGLKAKPLGSKPGGSRWAKQDLTAS